jgi:hypothetical protein
MSARMQADRTRELKIRASRVLLSYLADLDSGEARRVLSFAGELVDFIGNAAPGPARFVDLEKILTSSRT